MAGGVGPIQRAKRAFVRVLLHLASVYGIALAVNRECLDDDLVKAYRMTWSPAARCWAGRHIAREFGLFVVLQRLSALPRTLPEV